MQNLNPEPSWADIASKLMEVSGEVVKQYETQGRCSVRPHMIDAYTFVYDQCVEKPSKAEMMFTSFKQLLTTHLMRSAFLKDDCNFICEFNRMWECYSSYVRILARQVFSYLDRFFMPARDLGSLEEHARVLFEKQLLGIPSKRKLFISSFAKNVGEVRQSLIITSHHLKKFTKYMLLINPAIYNQLKKVYFAQSELFYRYKHNEAKHLGPIYYLNRVQNLHYFQSALAQLCMLQSVEELGNEGMQLHKMFQKEIVESYTDTFLNHPEGFLWALREKNFVLLNLTVLIYKKFEGFEKIKKRYYEYIIEECKVLLNSLENERSDEVVVTSIFNLFHNQNHILTEGFHKHQEIYVTLSNALQTEIGRWERLPEALFNHCKTVVDGGDFKARTESIRAVFEKVANKDEFIHKCEKWVESAILSQKVELTNHHEFLAFIHNLCGGQNTLKLHKILTDYLQENQHTNSTLLSCKILSLHLWERKFKDQIAIVPNISERLMAIWKVFQTDRNQKNPKKKLALLPLTSKLFLHVSFNKRTITVRCNLLQSCILFSLLEKGKTIDELQQEINVQKHLLHAFFHLAKFITVKDEVYEINWNYEAVGNQDLSLNVEENSQFIKAIGLDRNHLLQAGVVRVVKRRKEASFQEIYDYLCQNIKLFRPQPNTVKITLQKLIDRDFIEVSEQGLYIYKE